MIDSPTDARSVRAVRSGSAAARAASLHFRCGRGAGAVAAAVFGMSCGYHLTT